MNADQIILGTVTIAAVLYGVVATLHYLFRLRARHTLRNALVMLEKGLRDGSIALDAWDEIVTHDEAVAELERLLPDLPGRAYAECVRKLDVDGETVPHDNPFRVGYVNKFKVLDIIGAGRTWQEAIDAATMRWRTMEAMP